MSYPTTQLGGAAFNHHPPSSSTEAEYDRLRGLARQEAGKRSSCLAKSHQAYERGDGGAAHELSEEGKRHGALMEQYNQQASDYIFRENNAVGRVDGDTIDLHGQFVEEAERILEQRIRYARETGQGHLHVIVGKGNHSPGHIQKIKPKVEQICQELGLQYATEENAGRIYVNLQGGPAIMPEHLTAQHGGGYHQGYGYGGGQQQHHQQHQQQQQGYQQGYQGGGAGQQDPNAEIEAQVKKYLPQVLRMCQKQCCTVM
ncbi:Smr domain protein [Usnea florida]